MLHDPGANKVKIVDLYEVFRQQQKYEINDELKQELLTLPRGSASPAQFEYHNIPINSTMVPASFSSTSLFEGICVRL